MQFQKRGAAGECAAAFRRGQQGEKMRGQLFEAVQNTVELRRAELLGAGHRGGIAPQFLEPVVAYRNAEILAGHLFDFVRLVENHRMIFGQDAAFVVFVLERQVREKQVMVDNDDVALLRALMH